MTHRLHAPGPPYVEAARLRVLLRELDDVEHLERPVGFDPAAAGAGFARLNLALGAAFDHPCEVDTDVQDASHYGRITVPAAATDTGERLVLVVSNFGGMVVCAVVNPGAYDDAETDVLVAEGDAVRVRQALARSGYLLVAEDPLWEAYDGDGPLRLRGEGGEGRARKWFERYFDYL